MYDSVLYDFVEMEYRGLAEGATLSGQECPSCKVRGVFSVSRINRQLLWLCHRASCGFRRGKKYEGVVPDKLAESERSVIWPEWVELTDPVRSYLEENYYLHRLSINRAGLALLPEYRGGDRIYMPIRQADGTLVGYNAKALDKKVKPKAVTQTTLPSSIAWYPNTTRTRNVLVVEDQLSAIRASEHLTGCSILGTHLNAARIKEIMSFQPASILLALDRDAFDKAIRYLQEFRSATNSRMKVVRLTKDVKNMYPNEFDEFIEYLDSY